MYNWSTHFETFRGNTHFSAAHFTHKALILRNGLDGSSLLGYVVREDPAQPAVEPKNALEHASVALSRLGGGRRTGILPLACVFGLVLLPWLWRTPARKPAVFALVFFAVGWLEMAFTKDAGGSTHHTILLWPFPHLFVGATLAQASARLRWKGAVALAAIVVMICGLNLVGAQPAFRATRRSAGTRSSGPMPANRSRLTWRASGWTVCTCSTGAFSMS